MGVDVILVTGASGFIGSHVVRRLSETGRPVRALIRNRRRAQAEGRLRGLQVDWVEGDVTRPESLAPVMRGVSAVIHTVAVAIERGGASYESVNYQGTVHVVDASRDAGVRRFVNLSQLGARPNLPYRFLASKGRAQEYVAASGLRWTTFQPSTVWGPEDEFANSFARLVPFTPLIFPIIGSGQARFEPVWVEDLVTCIVHALDDVSTVGQAFEIGGPEVLTIEEIERRTLRALGARRLLVRVPLPLIRLPVFLMEVLLPAPPVTRSLLDLLAVDNVTTSNAIRRFVPEPRRFLPEHTASYMRAFRAIDTLRAYLGR
ncbi:MAG: complex I NDUFA9 subunit family protein [Armatimonadota bacterium]|nr:complex I NDUFA9 subunit family protein [Armatimonadota bacterium]